MGKSASGSESVKKERGCGPSERASIPQRSTVRDMIVQVAFVGCSLALIRLF